MSARDGRSHVAAQKRLRYSFSSLAQASNACSCSRRGAPCAGAKKAPGLPNQTAGTVDVYVDATLETGNAVEAEEDTPASALLLKHEFLDGGADDVTLATLGEVLLEPTLTARQLPGALQQPELRGLGQLHGGRLSAGGLRNNPKRLRLEHRAHLHADAGETLLLRLPVLAGHGWRTCWPSRDGLTAQDNAGCDQLLCNDVNCTDVFTTGVDASGAVFCAALTATGTVAGATLTSTGAV